MHRPPRGSRNQRCLRVHACECVCVCVCVIVPNVSLIILCPYAPMPPYGPMPICAGVGSGGVYRPLSFLRKSYLLTSTYLTCFIYL